MTRNDKCSKTEAVVVEMERTFSPLKVSRDSVTLELLFEQMRIVMWVEPWNALGEKSETKKEQAQKGRGKGCLLYCLIEND